MRPSSIILTLVVCASCLVACGGLSTASNQELSSGYVGCPPADVQISDETGHGIETWTATCRGRTFHCVRGGEAIFNCSEDYVPSVSSGGEQPPAPPPPPAAAAPSANAPEAPPE